MTRASGDSSCTDEACCGCGSEVEFGDDLLDPDQLAVRAAAFRHLLEDGRPAAVPAVAAEAGVEVSTGIDVLHRFETRGNARLSAGMSWASPD